MPILLRDVKTPSFSGHGQLVLFCPPLLHILWVDQRIAVYCFLSCCTCRYGQLLSSEPLRVNFHPSSLLSMGDMLAFTRDLSAAATASSAVAQPWQHAAQQASMQLADEQLLQLHGADSLLSTATGQTSMQQAQRQASALGQQPSHMLPMPMRALSCAEAPPSIEEQMALADGLTSRIPQR